MTDRELELIAKAYRVAAAEIKTLEERQEVLKAQLIAELDARKLAEVRVKEYTIRWGVYERCYIDTKGLKADRPEVADEYTVTQICTRFQVT